MRESGAEIGTIDGAMSRGFGRVEVLATGAVKFDSFFVRNVGEADGKKRMSEAQDSGTSAKVSFFCISPSKKESQFDISRAESGETDHFVEPS